MASKNIPLSVFLEKLLRNIYFKIEQKLICREELINSCYKIQTLIVLKKVKFLKIWGNGN